MKATRAVQKILKYYETDNPGVKGNLCRILMNGIRWNWKINYSTC